MPLRTPRPRRPLAALAASAAVLLAAACQDQSPTAPAARSATAAAARSAAAPTLDRTKLRAPAGVRLFDAPVPKPVGGVIDPGAYQCNDASPVNNYYYAQAFAAYDQNPDAFFTLLSLAGDQIAPYEAALFQTTATPQYFGFTGQFTKRLQKTERDVKRFWDVPSANIQLVGAHGTVLFDTRRTAPAYQIGFDLDAATAGLIATIVKDAAAALPALNGGNNAFLTFNAFAVSSDDGGVTPPKIVMGDGILEGYEAVGLGDVAPQGIYAHEFGHHIQYLRGYFADANAQAATLEDQPEATRYIELMADAFAGYYLTHSRGASMNRKRVEQFLEQFYQIGDCGFASPGHHGTPNQRLAAARFGFTVADEAQKQGHILTADQFHARFVAAYPGLVAPDAAPVAAAR